MPARSPLRRLLWPLLALLLVGLSAGPPRTAAQSQEPKPRVDVATPVAAAPPSGVSGSTYTSPTFGFTLAWDPAVWKVEDESLLDGYDGLQIGTDRSSVFVEGIRDYGGDPTACLADMRRLVAEREANGDLRDLPNARRPLSDPPGAASFVASYQVPQPDGSRPRLVEWVQCRTLEPGASVLVLTWNVPIDAVDPEFPRVQDLLASLRGPGAEATPVAIPEATPAATPYL